MPSDSILNNSQTTSRWIRWLSVGPLLLGCLVCVLVPSIRVSLWEGCQYLLSGDLDQLQIWAARLGAWAPLATLVLMICQAIAAPIPAVLVTATNSLLFGPFWGGLHSIVSANIAAAICYGLGRALGASVTEAFVPRRTYQALEAYLHQHGTLTVLISRLVPVVPFDPISYVAGALKMPFWPFFWATMIGQFPAGMAYSYLVHQTAEPGMGLVYSITTILALLGLGVLVKRSLSQPRGGES